MIILEQAHRIGGRIRTIKVEQWDDQEATTLLELGAARVSVDIHKQLLALMTELGFSKSEFSPLPPQHAFALRQPYIPSRSSLRDQARHYNISASESALLQRYGDGIIKVIQEMAERMPAKLMRQYTLGQALLHVFHFSDEFAALLEDAFGYDTPFQFLNAWDAIRELGYFAPPHGFMMFKPGLSQLTHRLAQLVQDRGVTIQLGAQVTRISALNPMLYQVHIDGIRAHAVSARSVILAVPATARRRLSLHGLPGPKEYWQKLVQTVTPVPLMRIYVQFERPWLSQVDAQMPMVMSSGPARMVIPMGPGAQLLQIYIDDDSANFFGRLSRAALKRSIHHALQQLLPKEQVPPPARVWTNYCGHAAHLWKPFVYSAVALQRMIQPWPRFAFVTCNEAYSQQQGWMEGSVVTAQLAVDRLLPMLPSALENKARSILARTSELNAYASERLSESASFWCANG